MNNAEHLAGIIRDANRRNMSEVVAGIMNNNASVEMWVKDALAETAALRKLLADVAGARDVKTAKDIAAKAANVSAIENPRIVAERQKTEQRKAYMALEKRIAEERAKRERAERIEAARRELARIEAERKREDELRALIAAADGDTIGADGTIKEPPAVDSANLPGCRIEH